MLVLFLPQARTQTFKLKPIFVLKTNYFPNNRFKKAIRRNRKNVSDLKDEEKNERNIFDLFLLALFIHTLSRLVYLYLFYLENFLLFFSKSSIYLGYLSVFFYYLYKHACAFIS
jgi:hypothetical protein